MPAQWTADIVSQLHIFHIPKRKLAEHLNITPEYLSMILNGHRSPEGAEQRFRQALNELIKQQDNYIKKAI